MEEEEKTLSKRQPTSSRPDPLDEATHHNTPGQRQRSHWGWGWSDRFPPTAERRQLALQLQGLLGFRAGVPTEPVALDAITLRPSRLAIPSELAEVLSDDHELRIHHTYGRSYPDLLRGFRGDYQGAPDWVARPADEEQVAAVLEWAEATGVAVVPVGGGTSVSGGVDTAIDDVPGVVALSLRRLDQVLGIDTESLTARIQAGATGPELEGQLAERGLTLRHFPQSFEFSTLGGWIATRAGGHFATLYTHIDDLVQAVRMITPRGVYQTLTVPSSGAGPDPNRLVLGSEGILGVITEATMRLRRRPGWRSRADVLFKQFDDAVAACRALAQSGLYPTNCRLLDAREALLNGLPSDGDHLLLLGFESGEGPVRQRLDAALELALAKGGRCPDGARHLEDPGAAGAGGRGDTDHGVGSLGPDTAAHWRQSFLDAPYLQSTLVTLGVIADTFETACTWDRFAELHRTVVRAVLEATRRHCGAGFVSCRFTHIYPDGPAPYFTWLAPGRTGEELAQWRAVKHAASEAILAQGGTITHHHSVGRLHRPWYEHERPPLFAQALGKIKNTFDPAGILNPGVLLPRQR